MNGELIGDTGNYVHDNMNAGNSQFQYDAEITLKTFVFDPRKYDNLHFSEHGLPH